MYLPTQDTSQLHGITVGMHFMRRRTKKLRTHQPLEALFPRYEPFDKRRANRTQRFAGVFRSLWEMINSHD
jgi:hypothetical protein